MPASGVAFQRPATVAGLLHVRRLAPVLALLALSAHVIWTTSIVSKTSFETREASSLDAASNAANKEEGFLFRPNGTSTRQDLDIDGELYPDSIADITWKASFSPVSLPGDPAMAVGKDAIIVATNRGISIFERNDAFLPPSQMTEAQNWDILSETMFSSLTAGRGPYDPRVLYNEDDDYFVVVYLAGSSGDPGQSSLLTARSKTGKPQYYDEADWVFGEIDLDEETPPSAISIWGDFPTHGYDKSNVYLAFNMFPTGPGDFVYSKLLIIGWDAFNAGGTIAVKSELKEFENPVPDFWDTGGAFTLQPAVKRGSGTDRNWIVSSDQENFYLWPINNPSSSTPTVPKDNALTVNIQSGCGTSYAGVGFGLSISQESSASPNVDSGDERLGNAVYHSDLDLVYTTNPIAVSGGGQGILIVGIDVSNPSSPSCVDAEVLSQSGAYYLHPVVEILDTGDIVVSYSALRDEYFENVVSFKRGGTWDPTAWPLWRSSSEYLFAPATGDTRWGDYAEMRIDPKDPERLWAVHQYASVDYFGAWSARVISFKVNNDPVEVGNCRCKHPEAGCIEGKCNYAHFDYDPDVPYYCYEFCDEQECNDGFCGSPFFGTLLGYATLALVFVCCVIIVIVVVMVVVRASSSPTPQHNPYAPQHQGPYGQNSEYYPDAPEAMGSPVNNPYNDKERSRSQVSKLDNRSRGKSRTKSRASRASGGRKKSTGTRSKASKASKASKRSGGARSKGSKGSNRRRSSGGSNYRRRSSSESRGLGD